MTKSATFLLLLASVLCTAAGPLAPAKQPSSNSEVTLLMRASDHSKMGELFRNCIQAKIDRDGIGDAEEKLRNALDKKWAKASKGRGPLALSDDLAAALWYASDYRKAKGIKKGKVSKLDVSVEYYGDDYVANNAVWVPKKYSPKQAYPVILCIPGVDEKPAEHLNDRWALSDLRDNAILVAIDMPKNPEYWGNLGEPKNPEKAGGQGILLQTFGKVRDTYAIDFDRVYLAGRGIGVAAAMQIANAFPDRFCGVIGRTGDAAEISPDNLSNLPTFFAGGGKRATSYAKAVADAGFAECTLNPSAQVEEVWAWVQANRRDSNPSQVTLVPGDPFPSKAYWLEIPRMEYADDARINAKLDSAANRIVIEATGIRSVKLFFNDTLVDMGKPVTVVLNGREHKDLIPHNFYSMIQMVYTSKNDAGKFYTAVKSYDIGVSKPD